MRRVMCVWCPLWPIQRLRQESKQTGDSIDTSRANGILVLNPTSGADELAEPAVVLFGEGRRGLQVIVCSREAAQWGIHVGMPLGEVQSLLPVSNSANGSSANGRLSVTDQSPAPFPITEAAAPKPRRADHKSTSIERLPSSGSVVRRAGKVILKRVDPAADLRRLRELAVFCQAYSPLVGLEEGSAPESIWLDISGSEALFGGELGLAETLQSQLAQQKIQIRVAIADTWGAAWAVSHFGNAAISVVPAGEQKKWLFSLPVAALRLSDVIQQSLQALSVATIGQLLRLPRASLPSRFGNELVRRADQALGLAPEILTVHQLAEPLFSEWLFEEPVSDRQSLDHVCEILLERLLVKLDERRAGLRELACHWLGTVAEPTLLRLLRPTTNRRHLQNLLRLQCEQRIFTSGVHGVRMEVAEIGLPPVRQATLFGDDADDRHPQALAELVDRLSIRLGRQAVLRPRLDSDPQPEFACQSVPWLDEPRLDEPVFHQAGIMPSASRLRCRPLRLLRTPQPLSMQAVSAQGLPSRVNQSNVVRISGPERIETGWWRGADVKRDYYSLDLANGATLWIFLDRDTRHWFLHGVFT